MPSCLISTVLAAYPRTRGGQDPAPPVQQREAIGGSRTHQRPRVGLRRQRHVAVARRRYPRLPAQPPPERQREQEEQQQGRAKLTPPPAERVACCRVPTGRAPAASGERARGRSGLRPALAARRPTRPEASRDARPRARPGMRPSRRRASGTAAARWQRGAAASRGHEPLRVLLPSSAQRSRGGRSSAGAATRGTRLSPPAPPAGGAAPAQRARAARAMISGTGVVSPRSPAARRGLQRSQRVRHAGREDARHRHGDRFGRDESRPLRPEPAAVDRAPPPMRPRPSRPPPDTRSSPSRP